MEVKVEKVFGVIHKSILLLPYFVVQLITRGGDWAIQNLLIYNYDVWALPAQIAGGIFNVLFGYILQKVIVFKPETLVYTPQMRRQFSTFVILRISLGLGVFVLLNILFVIWPEQYLIYSAVVTVFMWFFSYQYQRDIFQAKLRDLPRSVRKTREVVLRPKNTGRRIIRKIGAVLAACKI